MVGLQDPEAVEGVLLPRAEKLRDAVRPVRRRPFRGYVVRIALRRDPLVGGDAEAARRIELLRQFLEGDIAAQS
jgi:hypothetical protein